MTSFPALSSTTVTLLRGLLRKKRVRETEHACILEGGTFIQELLGRGDSSVRMVVLTRSFLGTCNPLLKKLLLDKRNIVWMCAEKQFQGLTDVVTPQGILAVVKKPSWDLSHLAKQPRLLGLYGERLQDPTNVGTMIRTAAAFGLDAIFLSPDSADVFNPKVVRGTAGMLWRIPIFYLQDPGLFAEYHWSLLAAQPPGRGSVSLYDIGSLPPRTILAFGNESQGLSLSLLRRATQRFHIPVRQGVESLNVATTAAVAVFYFMEVAPRYVRRKNT